MKKHLYLATVLALVTLGCHKDPFNHGGNTQTGLHVQILSGNSQTDTVGNKLKDSVIVKVTNNGTPVEGYTIQFSRSGCEDLTVNSATTSASGQASFAWYLSGETGNQSLKAVVLDASLNRRDSVSASAIGIAPSHGWHKGGCIQNFPVNIVTTLTSGRILASANQVGFPFYSDDNAISWHPLKTFSKNYFVNKIISSGSDIFLATQNQGIFHSADNGQTWANVSSGILSVLNFSDMTYTHSGKLIYCNDSGVFESDDMGQTWSENDYGLPMGASTYPIEQTNGDMYIIGSDASVYKLPVHTGNWVFVGDAGGYLLANVQSLYADDSGNMFIGGPHSTPGADGSVYESTDGGTTWTQVFTHASAGSAYANIDYISKLNGSYYFSFAGLGIFQTTNFSQFTNLTQGFSGLGIASYTVSANSSFVVGSTAYGVYYKVP